MVLLAVLFKMDTYQFQFQYIQCYGSSPYVIKQDCLSHHFNTSNVMVLLIFLSSYLSHAKISIHPMLWFFKRKVTIELTFVSFQYIQCYGSSCFLKLYIGTNHNFNTSNVMVLLMKGCKNKSMHFNFNTSNVMVLQSEFGVIRMLLTEFQYIQCYGSSPCIFITLNSNLAFQYIQCYGSSCEQVMQKIIQKFQYIQCYGTVNASFYHEIYYSKM